MRVGSMPHLRHGLTGMGDFSIGNTRDFISYREDVLFQASSLFRQ